METQVLNIFIADKNASLTEGLRNYLIKRFGTSVQVSTFSDGESALKMVDLRTGMVILDYNQDGINGNEILEEIKKINPKTQVVLLTSNEDVGVAIESFRKGASDYVIKGSKSWQKIGSLVYKIVTYPVRILVKEFGISKYFAIFILTFITVGVVVYFTLNLLAAKNIH